MQLPLPRLTVWAVAASITSACGGTQADKPRPRADTSARVHAVVRIDRILSTNPGFGGDAWHITLEPEQRFKRAVRQLPADKFTSPSSQHVASLVHELGTAPPGAVIVIDGEYTQALVGAIEKAGWRVVISSRHLPAEGTPPISLAAHQRYIPRLLASLATLQRAAEDCASKSRQLVGHPWISFSVDHQGHLSGFGFGAHQLTSPRVDDRISLCMALAVPKLTVAPTRNGPLIRVRLAPVE